MALEATDDLEGVLRYLRAIVNSCAPPIGVGSFDVLYASEREIVVWYSPARDDHHEGEVAIPTIWLATAWASLLAGSALERARNNVSTIRWEHSTFPPATAPGGTALTIVPSGAITVIGCIKPLVAGTCSSTRHRKT